MWQKAFQSLLWLGAVAYPAGVAAGLGYGPLEWGYYVPGVVACWGVVVLLWGVIENLVRR